MSSLLGAPIGPEIRVSNSATQFDHIPKLHELLPNGGWPGVIYAQACVHNMANAASRTQNPANMRPIRGTEYYDIVGPKGVAQMALVGCGTPISGASPDSGARLFFTDGEVTRLTGLPVGEYEIWFRAQPEEARSGSQEKQGAQGADRAREDPQDHARVQSQNAAQRKQHRPGGQES